MFKKLLSFFVLTLCVTGNSWAKIPVEPWKQGESVWAGTYYFYNIGADRYLSRGTNYGTRAVLDGAGLPIQVEYMEGGGGSLKTGVIGWGNTERQYVYFSDGGVYVDGPKTKFECIPVTNYGINLEGYSNVYYLKGTDNGLYLGWKGGNSNDVHGNDVVYTTDRPTSINYYWLLISPNNRTLDVTNLITNPDFEWWGYGANFANSNDITGWTKGGFQLQNNGAPGSNANATFAEKYTRTAPLGADNIHQNLNNLSAGIYTMTVNAQAINQGNSNAPSTKGVTLFLGENSTNIGAAGTYSVTTMLPYDGSLDMGVTINDDNEANWVYFDNVRLYRENIATYSKNGNELQFTGAGRLDTKEFKMDDYTVILGNVDEDGETPYVRVLNNASEGVAAYVSDRNGYTFANISNNLPTGWGTYYTIKPTNDGKLTVWVRGYHNDVPLVMVDSNGNIRKVIPGNEFSNGVTEIDCGALIGGETYYIFGRGQGTLFLQKTKYVTISSLYTQYGAGFKIVEMNDFDQYSESPGTRIWTKWKQIDCFVAVDEGSKHGPYAKYELVKWYYGSNESNSRAVYYPFEKLESRKRYVIEFDASIKPGSEQESQIAIYRSLPGQNSFVEDYLLSIVIPSNPNGTNTHGNWVFKVPGNDNALTADLNYDTWYHFLVDVDARTPNAYKIGIRVATDDNHTNFIAQTFGTINFTGDYQAKGIYHLAGRYNKEEDGGSYSKFDNILISSNQGSLGNLTPPTIAVTGISGNSREVTITSGYSDKGYKVKTYYQYTTDTSKTWTDFLNDDSWTTNWRSFEVENENQPGTKVIPYTELTAETSTVYIVRAISTINEYTTLQSDTVYLRVPVGDVWALTGGFAVQEMKQEADGYYTPKLRAYADTGIQGIDISKVKIKLQYLPLDYGIDPDTFKPVEQDYIVLCEGVANNSDLFDAENGITYYDFDVPRSGIYLLYINNIENSSDYEPCIVSKYYYKDKYKITYQTPDFADLEPLTLFQNFNAPFLAANSDAVANRIYGYTSFKDWQGAETRLTLKDWNNDAIQSDFIWNNSTKGTTATLNSVTSAHSSASAQTYDIRTIQYDATNPLIIRKGYGIVKDSDAPWNYRCGLAHIGMGNDIPEFTIDLCKGHDHNPSDPNHYTKVYPTPYIVSSKHVPECNYSVPARAALKQYKVYTPVEVKEVNVASGLASFSSYYDYYHVQDYFLENDELVDTYCSRDHYAFGGEYLLMQTWYAQARQGWLLAATQYRGTNIWDGYKSFTDKKPWGVPSEQNKTIKVELKIIDGVEDKYWPKHNELQPVLFNNETVNHSTHKLKIYGSSNKLPSGRPNQILYMGTRNEQPAMNFYCLPSADTEAKMANKTAYIQREKCTYAQYLAAQSSVKENGEMFIFSNGEDGEVVGIDMVENNATFSTVDDGAYYTISGQKVSTPTKGLYIHNGKKVYVK